MASLPRSVSEIQPQNSSLGALAPSSFSATHYLVAHKLAQGRTKASIARSLSISPYTINSMLQDPEFLLHLESIKTDMQLKTLLSREELQRRIDEDALISLETIQDIRDGEFIDAPTASVRLKAAESLIKRASNMPKESGSEDNNNTINIFSPQFIHTLVETARQIGDESVFNSANAALGQIASKDKIIDINEEKADYSPIKNSIPPPSTSIKTLDELLNSSDYIFEEDNYE